MWFTRLVLLMLPAIVASTTARAQSPQPWQAYPTAPEDQTPWTTPYTPSPGTIVDPRLRLAEAPGLPAAAPFGPASSDAATPPGKSLLPPGTRKGVFQKLTLTAATMPAFDDDSVGVTQFETSVLLGLPFPERESPLLITPAYEVRFIDGPATLDVPARLHDAEIDFHHFRRLNDRWIGDVAVTVGVYADDASFGNSDALRVSGRGLGIYEFTPEWKGIIGVVYLNRAGASIIPAVGLQYDTPDVKYDFIFPRPRAAYRVWYNGPDGCDERWAYLMAEFGGGIWSVERASGASDTLSSSDYRVLLGTERKIVGGISRKWEFGYVFGREFEYDSGAQADVGDTLLARVMLSY